MDDRPTLTSATPVLMSADYEKSKTFYTRVLGFDVAEEGGNPPRFGIFKRGSATLYLNAWNGSQQPTPDTWDAYIHVDDLGALLREFRQSQVPITKHLHGTPYGMDEFEITDPDGNVLCFGCDSDKA